MVCESVFILGHFPSVDELFNLLLFTIWFRARLPKPNAAGYFVSGKQWIPHDNCHELRRKAGWIAPAGGVLAVELDAAGVRTAYLFFPLWLGYILVVDALVWRRTGASLWTRSRKGFVLLFILSVPGLVAV